RYFPDPDLLPLELTQEFVENIRKDLPELPDAKRRRLQSQYGLGAYDAQVLTTSQALADYFEQAAGASPNPKAVANWIMGDLAAAMKAGGEQVDTIRVRPAHIAELVALIDEGVISGKIAKEVFAAMVERGEPPRLLVEALGLRQISDTGALEAMIDQVIAANPAQVGQYRGGKTALLAFFVGQVMKASRGQAQPALVNELLRKKLG
ncbi:MAG: Asp-tRNA(Asn)/Glu-tRNA(Gln) amidotransferase subunit GatB, partial [Terriglobales bacterium]